MTGEDGNANVVVDEPVLDGNSEIVVDGNQEVVETPSSDQITADDFRNNSKFLRKSATQNNPESKIEPEVTPNPEPEIKEPEVKVEPEVKPDEPVKVKLPTGDELTIEEILELKKGNMLQADYTRKTQELAEERKKFEKFSDLPLDDAANLWKSLADDPIGTIEYLREHYESQGITEPADPEVLKAKKEAEKLAEENKRLKDESEETKKQENRKTFEKYMNELADRYKDDGFNKEEVLKYCMDKGIPDPEQAFKAMNYDKMMGKSKQEIEEVNKKVEEKEKAAVTNYVKEKIVTNANHVPPVGTSKTGNGISISKPKTWAESRKSAINRLNNT